MPHLSSPSGLLRSMLSALMLFSYQSLAQSVPAQAASSSAAGNDIYQIEVLTLPRRYQLDARVEAQNAGTVSAQTSGAITAIYFDVNDAVEKNALLLTIDDTQQRAALAQAKANLSRARANNEDMQLSFQRSQRLFKQGTLSQGQLDSSQAQAKSAQAQVEAAQAALTQAQEQLAYTQVRAPYSGLVSQRHIELGELVHPASPLMSGLSLNKLRVVSDLPQKLASKLTQTTLARASLAQRLSIKLPHSNQQQLTPTAATLFPYADQRHHSVRLRADLPSEAARSGLRPGMWVTLVLNLGERPIIAVPQSAVISRSEFSGVYVLEPGSENQPPRKQLRQVRVGNSQRVDGQHYLEILAGLSAGERIVVNGYQALAESGL